MKLASTLALALLLATTCTVPSTTAQELGNPGLASMSTESDPYDTTAQTDDWYSFKGFRILEAVGCKETGWVIVGQGPTGKWEFLQQGESYGEEFQIAEIGTAQVRLTTKDAPRPRILPIVHRNLPADVLIMAVAKLYGYDMTIQGPIDKLVTYDLAHLDLASELKELFKGTAHQGCLEERSVLALEGELPKAWKAIREESNPRRFDFEAYRMSAAALIAQVESQTGYRVRVDVTAAPQLAKPLSVVWRNVTAPEAVHLLNSALSLKLVAEAPAKVEPEAPGMAKEAGDEKAERYFRNCLARAKSGKAMEAAKGLRNLVRKRPENARYCNAYGKMLWTLGLKEKAVKAWKRSLRIDPENAYARRVLDKVGQI